MLIDSPPVLAVADAVILSRLADTTLLVARHGQSTQKSLERAYRTLNDVEDKNIGIVVNGVHRDSVSSTSSTAIKARVTTARRKMKTSSI